MVDLSEAEIRCLRSVADEPAPNDPPCPEEVLTRLMELGLIECRPKIWAPLEAVDTRYRLTLSGEAFLNQK